ncbi:MAG: hypothetical protein R2736_09830 [Solirubrobacterales bacterium]
MDPFVGQLDDGLVEDHELVMVDRAAEVGFGVQALEGLALQVCVEDLDAAAAGGLGAVHGGVGFLQQSARGARLVVGAVNRDADREADGHRSRVDAHGCLELVLHPIDQPQKLMVGASFEQRDELVAAEAADGVGRPNAGAQAPGDLLQDRIAPGMPERVVDALEVVEVHEDDGDRVATAASGRDRVFGAVLEQRPVRQAGQGIVQPLVRELLGGALARGRRQAAAPRAAATPIRSSAARAIVNPPNKAHATTRGPSMVAYSASVGTLSATRHCDDGAFAETYVRSP